MCAGVTKEGIFITKKIRFCKAVQNFLKKFFCVYLLINIVYYVYINLFIHIYIPKQAIRVAKLGIYCFLLEKIPHKCRVHMTLTLTLSFNFWGNHT